MSDFFWLFAKKNERVLDNIDLPFHNLPFTDSALFNIITFKNQSQTSLQFF